MNQAQVDSWLNELLAKLKNGFGARLCWVAHHGSWARGEPRPESDIDVMVVLDSVNESDLQLFSELIASMPDARELASGLLMSLTELKHSRHFNFMQLFYGRKELHGSLDGIVDPPRKEDCILDISWKASDNLLIARHYLLFPHDLPKVVTKLRYPFKNCFYALQSWLLLTQGKFVPTKKELLKYIDEPWDKEVIGVACDWNNLSEKLLEDPLHYIMLLERWAKGMITKLESWEKSHETSRLE